MPTLFTHNDLIKRVEEYEAVLNAGKNLVVVRTTEEPKITKPLILPSRQIVICR